MHAAGQVSRVSREPVGNSPAGRGPAFREIHGGTWEPHDVDSTTARGAYETPGGRGAAHWAHALHRGQRRACRAARRRTIPRRDNEMKLKKKAIRRSPHRLRTLTSR